MQAQTDNYLPLIVTGEVPLVRDLDIGVTLGMAQPERIRRVIDRNKRELQGYCGLRQVGTKPSELGGRPGTEYHLTEEQALCVCALSRAPKAPAVRRMLIETFMAYRRNQLVVAAGPDMDLKSIGGVVKGIIRKTLTDEFTELKQALIEVAEARDARRYVTAEFMGASDVIKPFDVPKKGRRALVIRASASLRRFSNQQGKPMRQSAETGRWLYHVDAIAEWLDATGRQMIAGHKERHGKQPNLFPISGWKRYRPEPPRPSDNRPSA